MQKTVSHTFGTLEVVKPESGSRGEEAGAAPAGNRPCDCVLVNAIWEIFNRRSKNPVFEGYADKYLFLEPI